MAMGLTALILFLRGILAGELLTDQGFIEFRHSPVGFVSAAAIYALGGSTLLFFGVINWRDAPRVEHALERHLSAKRAIDVAVRQPLVDESEDHA